MYGISARGSGRAGMRDVRGPAGMLRQSGASAAKQRRAPILPRIFVGLPACSWPIQHVPGPARIFCGTKIASVHTMRPRVFSLDPIRSTQTESPACRAARRIASNKCLQQMPATKACRERLQCAATTRAETLEPPSFLHLFRISTPWPPHATACCSLPS